MTEQNPEVGSETPTFDQLSESANQVDESDVPVVPEAPVVSTDDPNVDAGEPVEPEPVEVAPSDPATTRRTIMGKEYEVTPEGGYRLVED